MRSVFIWLSRSKRIPAFTKKRPFFWRFASRFVAGETLSDALAVVKGLNESGMMATLDHLGENVASEEEARKAAKAYVKALHALAESGLDCNVSLKLTQMGLDVSRRLCIDNVRNILDSAKKRGNFVRLDMEGSSYAEKTLEIYKELVMDYRNVGVVIQSSLYRSGKDVEDLIGMGANVRLVKGAYKEPPSVAFPKKGDVDSNYAKLMGAMLSTDAQRNGCKVAIATHDEKMIGKAREIIKNGSIPQKHYEFQMLYGIRRDLQRKLAEEGHPVRVYVPYGKEWYPYFMRRLAERPANVIFLTKNLFKP